MTTPGVKSGIISFSCSGHMKDPIYQYQKSSGMMIELGEKYHVWLNPILLHHPRCKGNLLLSTQNAEIPTDNENCDPSILLQHPRCKGNLLLSTQNAEVPTDNENCDPSLAPFRTVTSSKPSFLTILNTMLHMFHLQGQSAPQIGSKFAGVGCVFTAIFIQGVVGVSTLHTPWPMEEKVQIKQRINQRMHTLHFVLEMVRKGKPTEEIAGLCLHNGHTLLEFSQMEKGKKQLKGASVQIYRTELAFVRDLSIYSS